MYTKKQAFNLTAQVNRCCSDFIPGLDTKVVPCEMLRTATETPSLFRLQVRCLDIITSQYWRTVLHMATLLKLLAIFHIPFFVFLWLFAILSLTKWMYLEQKESFHQDYWHP